MRKIKTKILRHKIYIRMFFKVYKQKLGAFRSLSKYLKRT